MIQRLYTKCREHAKKNGVSIFSVFFDYLHSRLFYGFCGEDYFLNSSGYALKNFQKKQFFSHSEWIKLRNKLNDENFTYILKDKVETLKYFSKYIKHDWCYPREHTKEQYEQFLNKHQRIIYKPISEEGGKGIGVLQHLKDNLIYESIKAEDLLLEECISQHPDMCFNNASVNTIRVYSILDRYGKVHIVKAVLRAGVGNSVVDNFHSGGVIYPINIKYGFIESYGVRRFEDKGIFIHPETNIIMLGYVIPHWDLLKATVEKMAESIPEIRYIGWDMVITPDGVDLIEANDNADHALFGRIGYEKLYLTKLNLLV